MLAERKESYESIGESLSKTPAEFKEEFPFLNEVDSKALATEWMNLNKAYGNFFRDNRVGFPKFKSKKNDRKSYTTIPSKTRAFDVSQKFIKLPKIGLVRCKIHGEIPSDWKIKSVTVSQTPTGKFYVSVLCEYETEIRPITLDRNNAIGIDYKSNGFGVTSEGEILSNHRYFRENQSKLSREQRRLSRKKKNSKNFKKQKMKVALVHEYVSNCRLEQAHQLSHFLAEKYDVVCLEDINLQNIAQSLNLGKSTNDNGFGMLEVF